jgi:hypothetical protein
MGVEQPERYTRQRNEHASGSPGTLKSPTSPANAPPLTAGMRNGLCRPAAITPAAAAATEAR